MVELVPVTTLDIMLLISQRVHEQERMMLNDSDLLQLGMRLPPRRPAEAAGKLPLGPLGLSAFSCTTSSCTGF